VNEAAEGFGHLDILVNVASVYTRRAYNELREVTDAPVGPADGLSGSGSEVVDDEVQHFVAEMGV